ncbi:MAG TPA: ABC transporter permease subunit [Acidimicrobiales bacterium]|nr:ABC transporter permease subunit [Acidimicrobiales bacterium]
MNRGRRVWRAVWPPVLFGVVFLLLWEGAVEVFDWKPYFLPKPSAIWEQFVDNSELIRRAALVSGGNALIGLLAGTALGVAMSFLLMRFRLLNDMLTPLAIALNAIPIFVLVAVFNNMFSLTSEVPRRLMVTLVVYFIVLINVARGLREVPSLHLELLRSYAATPRQVIAKARIPNAVPYLFTALKIAAPAAVITAFVAEYFGGTQNGLGTRITSNLTANTAAAWAYVLGACLVGLAFYLISILLETITTRGARSPGGGPT